MNVYFSLLLILLTLRISPLTTSEEDKDEKLLFVYEHARHGVRQPDFDSDEKFIDEYGTEWSGSAELTAIGQRQHYIIGVRNRLRYSQLNFLNFDKYVPQELLVYSTSSPRTINSLQAELFGMFPPGKGDKILNEKEREFCYPAGKDFILKEDESEKLQEEIRLLGDDALINKNTLIPIKMFTESYWYKEDFCPGVKEYNKERMEKIKKTIFYNFSKKIDDKYGEVLQKFFNKENRDFIYDFDIIAHLLDVFVVNLFNGKSLEIFYNQTNIDKNDFFELDKEATNLYCYVKECDNKTCILGATQYMRDVLSYMKKRIKHENEENNYAYPKMLIHGGHDSTLSTIQFLMEEAFNITKRYIDFASTIYFELYRNIKTNKYSVKYFREYELVETFDYDYFKDKMNEYLWDDSKINEFCYKRDSDEKTDNKTNDKVDYNEYKKIKSEKELYRDLLIGIGILSGIFLILSIVMIIKYKKLYKIMDKDLGKLI